ncbi:PAS domain S-box protein [Sorangium sp. So ce1000]|uniref:PAS domain S-box protein n=1 Tax=Sorangium sp. So ce1000 TaxID=3133325 RepID=UPI003F6018C2
MRREDGEILRLRDRIAALEAHAANLERDLEGARQAMDRLQRSQWRLSRLLEIPNEALAVLENGRFTDVNSEFERMFRCRRDEAVGRNALDFAAPESRDLILGHLRSGHGEPYEATLLRLDGTTFIALMRGRMVEEDGRMVRVTSAVDITAQKRAESTLRESFAREQVIRAQAELLAEISTPLLPIAPGVLVMPLIGQVNAERARNVIETLTQGVAAHGARVAILDITGMRMVDAQIADTLLTAARAVGLLGARVLLTGIGPETARTMVEVGGDLGSITTLGTLEQGVAHALRSHR